jgi:hypothetical protein
MVVKVNAVCHIGCVRLFQPQIRPACRVAKRTSGLAGNVLPEDGPSIGPITYKCIGTMQIPHVEIRNPISPFDV